MEAEVYAHSQLEAAAAQRNIFMLVEDVMRRRLSLVDAHLPRVSELVGKEDPESQAELRLRLRLIGMHLGYCKRVGVAVLGYASGQTKDPIAELSHALLIACSDFSREGDQAHIDLKVKGDYNIYDVLAVLDACHSVLAGALLSRSNSVFANAVIDKQGWSVTALLGGIDNPPEGWIETVKERLERTERFTIEFEDPDWRLVLGGTHKEADDSLSGMRLSVGSLRQDGSVQDPLHHLTEVKND